MKSEHRHELAENDLSKVLGQGVQKLDEHQNTILSVAVVVALIAAALIYWTRMSRFERSSGWAQLAASSSPEDFMNVAEAHAGSAVGDWARLRAGDGFLQEGIRLSITDRPASTERLEQAKESFEALTPQKTLPAIREQAMNGLAVTLESLSTGDTEPAIAAYQNLLTAFPETRFKSWAEDRIDALKLGSTQDFYAWFHQQNPKPADMPLPNDQLGGGSSPLESLLPESGLGNLNIGDEPFTPPMAEDGEDSTTDGSDVNPFEPESTSETNESETDSETNEPEASTDEAPAAEETPASADEEAESPAPGE